MRFSKYFLFTFYLFFLNSCTSVKEVEFEKPVDTSSKEISFQTKGTYTIEDLKIFASNDFEGARLNGLEKANDSTAIIIINPENEPINRSPYYAFKIWSDNPRPVYLTFQYPQGYKHRYLPKIKRENGWQVIDSSNIYQQDSIISIKVNLNKKPLLIAAQELQTSSDVKDWYTQLAKGKDYVRVEKFGESLLGRDLPVLDIYKGDKKNKPVLILLTRQHPPEVTGYFAFQEFLATILNGSQLSSNFLSKYRILAFPIMNPDGVDLGHWRHNAGGVDTNRDWSKYRQPEILQTVTYIQKQLKKNNTKIVLGLDFHSTRYDVFYTNKERKNTFLPNFIDDWFAALETNIDSYEVNEASGNSSQPVSKGWFLYGHNATGITYEIGDATPRERIKEIGKVSAQEMMKILIEDYNCLKSISSG